VSSITGVPTSDSPLATMADLPVPSDCLAIP
jgi:hypothetical protein